MAGEAGLTGETRIRLGCKAGEGEKPGCRAVGRRRTNVPTFYERKFPVYVGSVQGRIMGGKAWFGGSVRMPWQVDSNGAAKPRRKSILYDTRRVLTRLLLSRSVRDVTRCHAPIELSSDLNGARGGVAIILNAKKHRDGGGNVTMSVKRGGN